MPGPQLRGSNPFTGNHTTPRGRRACPAPTVRQKKSVCFSVHTLFSYVSIRRDRRPNEIMRQNILIAPAVAGVADGAPLAHAAAVAVAVDIKDKAVQIGVVADREALAAQAAPVNALAGQQILAEPAPADGADARVRADLDLGDPSRTGWRTGS